MNSVIQEWYKSNKNTKIQELIMRVTNYAWGEMTLFEQGTLREEAAQEFTEMTAELVKHREEIRTLKELLYEAQYINMLSDGEGGGAWSVNGYLEQRIEKALEGFEIAN